MKKLLVLLLLSTSFSVFSEIEMREMYDEFFDYSLSDFCIYQPGIQNRGKDIWELYFPNEDEGITATSICVLKDSYGQYGEKGKLVKGIQQGTWFDYYRNGQIKYEENYKDGIIDGKFTMWSDEGQKLREHYSQGHIARIDGEFIAWFPNGQLKSKRYYKDFQLDGKMTWWQMNGKKWIEAVFINDERIGECKILNIWDLEKVKVDMSPSFADQIKRYIDKVNDDFCSCLLYTSPSPRDS